MGALFLTDNYFECRRQQQAAIEGSIPVVEQVAKEFAELSGRSYGICEGYALEDAELVLVALGSTVGTAKVAVDQLRADGVKAGILKPRLFRPFPGAQFIDAIQNAKAVAVMDRALSYGVNGGPLYHELRSHAYGKMDVPFASYIYGLGGRDIVVDEIVGVYRDLADVLEKGTDPTPARYVGVREA
jgi:pyruvate ferredoxin oxidoreductase alpha subunit